jgi:hypothetical protein
MQSRYYVGPQRHVEGLYYPVYTLPAGGVGKMRQATPTTRQFVGISPLADAPGSGNKAVLVTVAVMALAGLLMLSFTKKEDSPLGF